VLDGRFVGLVLQRRTAGRKGEMELQVQVIWKV